MTRQEAKSPSATSTDKQGKFLATADRMTLPTQYRNRAKTTEQTNHITIFISEPISTRVIWRLNKIVVETDPKQANANQTI